MKYDPESQRFRAQTRAKIDEGYLSAAPCAALSSLIGTHPFARSPDLEHEKALGESTGQAISCEP